MAVAKTDCNILYKLKYNYPPPPAFWITSNTWSIHIPPPFIIINQSSTIIVTKCIKTDSDDITRTKIQKYITPREGVGLGYKDDKYEEVVKVKLIVISFNPQ